MRRIPVLSFLILLVLLPCGCGVHRSTSDAGPGGQVHKATAASGLQLEIVVPANNLLQVYDLAFSPDGQTLACAGDVDGFVALWNTKTGRLRRTLPVRYPGRIRSATTSIAYSPDGRTVAYNVDTQTGVGRRFAVQLWDAMRGVQIRTLTDSTDGLDVGAFSANGRYLTVYRTGNAGMTLEVWDTEAVRLQWSVPISNGATLTRDGRFVAVLAPGKQGVSMRDVSSGRTADTLFTRAAPDYLIGLSADERFIIGQSRTSAKDEDETAVWDVGTGRKIQTIRQTPAVTFSPNSGTIAHTTYPSGDIELRDAMSGALLKTLKGHERAPYVLTFSPDGSKIASGGKDGTVRLWDVRTGRLLLTALMLRPHPGHPLQGDWIAFTPDGYYEATKASEAFMRWRLKDEIVPFSEHALAYHRRGAVLNRVITR